MRNWAVVMVLVSFLGSAARADEINLLPRTLGAARNQTTYADLEAELRGSAEDQSKSVGNTAGLMCVGLGGTVVVLYVVALLTGVTSLALSR